MTDTAVDYEPARVRIVADDTRSEPQPKFRGVTTKTYLASTIPELILPRSKDRKCAQIAVLGVVAAAGNIVLADSQADAGQAVTFVTEAGTIAGMAVQPGMVIPIYHHDEVWLARLGSAGTAPLVSVLAEYEGK